jgi:hypothetical protein
VQQTEAQSHHEISTVRALYLCVYLHAQCLLHALPVNHFCSFSGGCLGDSGGVGHTQRDRREADNIKKVGTYSRVLVVMLIRIC